MTAHSNRRVLSMLLVLITMSLHASAQSTEPYTLTATLTAPDPAANRELGVDVALDGDLLAIGAYRDDTLASDSGAVYLFTKDTDGESWSFDTKLYASDWEESSGFGSRLVLEGDRLLVGAPLEDGGANSGAAYFFERADGLWTETARLPSTSGGSFFGASVDLQGDRAIVGASWESHSSVVRTGAVYVYERIAGLWTRRARLIAPAPGRGDTFGESVSLAGDLLAVGANSNPYGHDPFDSGAAFLFAFDGTSWQLIASFTSPSNTLLDQFGISVALEMTSCGPRLLVGADRDEGSGRAYLYAPDGDGVWQLVATLAPPDQVADGRFGHAVAFAGDRILITATGPGTLHVFEQEGAGWTQVAVTSLPDGPGSGTSLEIDGARAAVGSALAVDASGNTRAGAVSIFETETPTVQPTLQAAHRLTAGGETVTIPIELDTRCAAFAGMAFSLDFDATCLAFDPTDSDGDGIPDAVTFHVPASFFTSVFVDLADTDGELDFAIAGIAERLGDGPLVSVSFTATCTPPHGTTIIAPVGFSADPAPSFSDPAGRSIPGTTGDGAVEILPGLRGDCNADGRIDAADLVSCLLEVFDADGADWLAVPGSTFVGDPVGCDANADTLVDVADLTCKNRLIFGLPCLPGFGLDDGSPPTETPATLTLPLLVRPHDGIATTALDLDPAGHEITGVQLSLGYDPARVALDPADHDADGVPDAIRFVGTSAAFRRVTLDPTAGRIQILVADLIATPRPFLAGPFVEIDLRPLAGGALIAPLAFSTSPPLGFATADGQRAPARGLLGQPLFADGFETGDLLRWTTALP